MSSNKKTIGIIGVGMVGGAMYQYYPDAIPYDVVRYPENEKTVGTADIIFICVPTPYVEDVGCDTSIVEKVFELIPENKIVVIRSTVIPGTTDRLQKQFSNHHLLFNPEFLDEITAAEDFRSPNRQIVGFTTKSEPFAESVMALLPDAPYKKIMPAKIAETVKYFGNSFYASKVIFANQIYDLCEKLGIGYETVRNAVSAHPRIGPSHLQVFHKGYRGYGGKCLPKDVKALIHLARTAGSPMTYLELVDIINEKITNGEHCK